MKKIFKLLSIFALTALFSISFLLPTKNEIQNVFAADDDITYSDVILYPVALNTIPAINRVYDFDLDNMSSGTSLTFDLLYFKQADFIVQVDSNSLNHLQLTFSSTGSSATLAYKSGITTSTLVSLFTGSFSIVLRTLPDNDLELRPFFRNNASVGSQPVFKTDDNYYSLIFEQIADLNTQISGLNSQIAILQSSIQNNQNSIALLQGRISELNSQVENLHDSVVSIQADYDTLEAQYEALEISYQDLLSSETALLSFINGFIHSTLNSEYTANTLTQGVAYLNTQILSNQEEIESLTSQIAQLDEQIAADDRIINQLYDTIEDLEAQVDSLQATNSVFGLIRSAFSGVVPLLDLQLMPNITIGMILTIPFVLAVLGFILKALG